MFVLTQTVTASALSTLIIRLSVGQITNRGCSELLPLPSQVPSPSHGCFEERRPREEVPGRVSRQPTHTAVRAHLRVTGRRIVGGQRGMACVCTKHTYADILNTNKEHSLTSASKELREAGRIMSWGSDGSPSENSPGRSFPGCPNGKAAHDSQNCSHHPPSVFVLPNCAEYCKIWLPL